MKTLISLIFLFSVAYAQNCNININGRIIDEHDNTSLELAAVVLGDNEQIAYTDEHGKFTFKNVCVGAYHINFSHISCESKEIHIEIKNDTSIVLYLEHHEELLKTITIVEEKTEVSKSVSKSNIQGAELDKRQGQSLGELIKSIAGVNSLQTGAGVSKPIIHGLFGNRVQILNNGVAIQGQQWGNEHAPEIDPFSIQKITVIKGAYALKYGTRAMGGAVLLGNDDMPKDAHIHGSFNLIGFTNGLKLSSSLNLEGGIKKNDFFKWRTQASYSKSGDNKAANYYLSNTAREKAAANIQLEYKKQKFKTQLQFNTYYSNIGILRGSHIGNLTDLEDAFERDVPFYTEDKISYTIAKPKQTVFHNTLKLNHVQFLNKGKLSAAYAFQNNQRKEFDVRRSSDKASLFLNLQSHDFDLTYAHKVSFFNYEIGMQYQNKVNFNDPGLNVKALIPNYRNNQISLFSINEIKLEKLSIEFGARYENQNMLVKFYEGNDLKTPRHLFHNYAFNAGVFVPTKVGFSSRTNASLVNRSPEINELYSDGLHHGAAAIEIGNPNFTNEKMWSFNQTFTFSKGEVFHIELNPYYQFFYNYINLQAQEDLQLTIRGAFPVYEFKQSKASIWGFDLAMQTQVYKKLYWNFKAAIVRGSDLDNNANLPFMPADYLQNSLNYTLSLKSKMQELSFGVNGKNTLKQIRVPAYDFLSAPEGYFILGAEISGKVKFNKLKLNWQIEATNLLNTAYRDYLNRWRYYADDLGINIAFRTKFIF